MKYALTVTLIGLMVLVVAARSSADIGRPPVYTYDNVENFFVADVGLLVDHTNYSIITDAVTLKGKALRTVFAGLVVGDIGFGVVDMMCITPDKDLNASEVVPYKWYAPSGKLGWLVHQIPDAKLSYDYKARLAGLNFAAWEIAYDASSNNPYDLTNGLFRVSATNGFVSSAIGYANGYLNLLGSQTMNYSYVVDGNNQDLIFDPPATPPTPEPMSLVLASMGLSGVLVLRRKR